MQREQAKQQREFDAWDKSTTLGHYAQWNATRRERWPHGKHFAYQSFVSDSKYKVCVAYFDRHTGYCTVAR